MTDTSSRRSRRAYTAVLNFLEEATQEEFRTFYDSFSAEDRRHIGKFIEDEEEESSKTGRPPKVPVTPAFFFKVLDSLGTPGDSKDLRMTRQNLIRTFKELAGPKGSLFAGALWDNLPRDLQEGGGKKTRKAKTLKPVRGFAVVQSEEKPWVKEPNYRRWLAKLRRHTAKVRKHGEEKHPDNLCLDSKICKGDLGIPRRLMPQFTSARDIKSFTRFIDKFYGIKAVKGTRRAGQLRPSQEEINRVKVEGVKEEIKARKLNPNVPLIVSEDGFVIDGHHRWAAYKSHQPSKKMPVLVVKDTARDVLSMAATWGAKHHQF